MNLNKLLPLFLLLLFCNTQPAPPPGSTMLELMSGRSVRVYSITRISFVNNQLPPSLQLTYETTNVIADTKELREEAGAVFFVGLQAKADSSGNTYAMVKSSAPFRGHRTETFTFRFVKTAKGRWVMRESGK